MPDSVPTRYAGVIATLRHSLEAHANPRTKAWWEGYVKGSAPFLGVKMGTIRATLHSWHRDAIGGRLSLDEQKRVALSLIREDHTEEKLAGMLFLQEILIPAGGVTCETDLRELAALLSDGSIYDWNVCDWFCIKVLGPLIEQAGQDCAKGVSAWCRAENLWQARASVVAFVVLAGDSTYYPLILDSCRVLVGREERFSKTAVGWILRDISKRDQALVRGFIEENLDSFSLESLRNALKYFGKNDRNRYVAALKASHMAARG
jgi:3-methyladenine DNA glycosylase AlkD